MNRKLGAVPLLGGAATPCNTTLPGPRFTSVPSGKWHLDPSSRLATIDMGQKLGGGCALFSGELGPHRIQSRLGRGLPPCIPSGILVHPAVWPQQTAFGPCLLWPNGWMDEDITWYRSRLRPRPHCVRREPSSPGKAAQQPPSLFGPCLSWSCTVAHLSYCWALVYEDPTRK